MEIITFNKHITYFNAFKIDLIVWKLVYRQSVTNKEDKSLK